MTTPAPEAASTVVVVAGGDVPDWRLAALLPAAVFVIAADSGADHALALGWPVHELIGDLDSVTPATLASLERSSTVVTRHPAAKDFTDLELALQRAAELRAARIVVVGGHGGRADHHLASFLLLGAHHLAPARVTAWHGTALLTVVRPGEPTAFTGPAGSLLSLLPVGGPAVGVITSGLGYPLCGERLEADGARGLSNVIGAGPATVALRAGTILAIQPDALDHFAPPMSGPASAADPTIAPEVHR